ncbi:hypothetical protein GCM10023238_12340 [Streptomyces heliomycini]
MITRSTRDCAGARGSGLEASGSRRGLRRPHPDGAGGAERDRLRFLYDIRVDRPAAQAPAPGRSYDEDGHLVARALHRRRWFQLTYLVTARGQSAADEHRLLSQVLGTMVATIRRAAPRACSRLSLAETRPDRGGLLDTAGSGTDAPAPRCVGGARRELMASLGVRVAVQRSPGVTRAVAPPVTKARVRSAAACGEGGEAVRGRARSALHGVPATRPVGFTGRANARAAPADAAQGDRLSRDEHTWNRARGEPCRGGGAADDDASPPRRPLARDIGRGREACRGRGGATGRDPDTDEPTQASTSHGGGNGADLHFLPDEPGRLDLPAQDPWQPRARSPSARSPAVGRRGLDLDLLLVATGARPGRLGSRRLYGYLNDDLTRRRPTVRLALELCMGSAARRPARFRSPRLSR